MRLSARESRGEPRLVLLLALALVGARADADAVLAGEPADVVARLGEDRLVVLPAGGEEAGGYVLAYVVFERPREQVLALLSQAERQPEYRPEIESVRTVRRFENGRVDEQRIRIAFQPLVYRLVYTRHAETGRVSWALDPEFENDLRRMEGFWELYDFRRAPARTLGRFGSSVDVGPALPALVQRTLTRKTVLRYVDHTRRWVDSGGTWRPRARTAQRSRGSSSANRTGTSSWPHTNGSRPARATLRSAARSRSGWPDEATSRTPCARRSRGSISKPTRATPSSPRRRAIGGYSTAAWIRRRISARRSSTLGAGGIASTAATGGSAATSPTCAAASTA